MFFVLNFVKFLRIRFFAEHLWGTGFENTNPFGSDISALEFVSYSRFYLKIKQQEPPQNYFLSLCKMILENLPQKWCCTVEAATRGGLRRNTPTQVFSCEICEIFTNTYFVEHLRTAASPYYSYLYPKSALKVFEKNSFCW